MAGVTPMIALASGDYHRVAELLRMVPINTFFARAVVERHVAGRVFVDDRRDPRACYVAHPYGMSLLFGTTQDEPFGEALYRYLMGEAPPRRGAEWLQVFPAEWSASIEAMLGPHLYRAGGDAGPDSAPARCVVRDVRVNFRFDPRRDAALKQSLELPADCVVIGDADYIYAAMRGSVVPSAFWDSAAEFARRGAAYALVHRGELAATAFASFVLDDALELGIETYERFRGRGFAVHACSALIDHCIEHRLEPVWACRESNVGSYRLALKLGFEHVRSLPYYCLPLSPCSAPADRSGCPPPQPEIARCR